MPGYNRLFGVLVTVDIDNIFVETLKSASYVGLPAVFENQDDTPKQQKEYIELLMFQNQNIALGLSEVDEGSGVFRVILYWPRDTGDIKAKQKAEEIRDLFPIRKIFTKGNSKVQITQNHREPGVPEPGWFKIVVSIYYRVFIN